MAGSHIITPEELKAIIRQCFREDQATIREAIREELKDAGLTLGNEANNMAASEDFRFLRRTRMKFESASAKVGGAVILAVVGGFVWLVVAAGKMFWAQR